MPDGQGSKFFAEDGPSQILFIGALGRADHWIILRPSCLRSEVIHSRTEGPFTYRSERTFMAHFMPNAGHLKPEGIRFGGEEPSLGHLDNKGPSHI